MAIGVLLVQAQPLVSATASSRPAMATVDAVFLKYCGEPDSSRWFCVNRAADLSLSHKWEIVEAYCFDEVGATFRSRDDEAVTTRLKQLTASTTTKSRGDVCSLHHQVVPPMALEFNHRTSEWSASNKGFEYRRRRIEIDPVLRVPTAHLVTGDTIGIVITDTNPILFVANRGEAKEDNIDQVRGLELLLGLIGTSVSSLGRDFAKLDLDSNAAFASLRELKGKSERDLLQALRDNPGLMNSYVVGLDANRQQQAIEREQEDLRLIRRDLGRLREWNSEAGESIKPVKTRLEELLDHRARIQVLAQRLEHGNASFTGSLDATLEDPAEWSRSFKTLSERLQKVPALAGCELLLDTFSPVVVTRPDDAIAVHTATIRFGQLFASTGDVSIQGEDPPCAELRYVTRLKAASDEIEQFARQAAREPSDKTLADGLRRTQAEARERHLQHSLILGRLVREIGSVRQSIRDTLTKEEETRKAGVALGLVAGRVRDASIRRLDSTGPTMLVFNRIYVQDEKYSSKFTKIRQTPLKIALNSPYGEQVPSERPKETATTYRFVRRNFDRLTFGVGVVYTGAFSATYVAADSNPTANTTQTTTTTVGGPPPAPVGVTQVVQPELKVIVEKDRESRTGSYALFANYRLGEWHRVGLGGQFGVGTSTDTPALLGGLSVNFGSYVTGGVGGGIFRVKRLGVDSNGHQQKVNDIVGSTDDIRIANHWKGTYYISFSVNLNGIPLFK